MPIFKKMHQIQAATRSLAANASGQTGAARYDYVSGSKLLGVIRPRMDELGVILTQEVLDVKNEPITYMTRNGEKTEMFTCAHLRFTWIDSEDGSSFENEFYANGMNAWDKGLGSALTYAERYYLMKTFHIATDEDDIDALVKEEAIKPEKNSSRKPAPKVAEPKTSPENNSASTRISIAEDNDEMIQKVAKWAAGDVNRVLRARDGYDWGGNALAKFYAIVAEIQEQK